MTIARREFLKTVSIGAGAACVLGKWAWASSSQDNRPVTVRIVNNIELHASQAGRIWLPIPKAKTPYQRLMKNHWMGDLTNVAITKDPVYDAQILSAEWDKAGSHRFELTHEIRLQAVATGEPAHHTDTYLHPTAHVATDGIVQETAKKIVGSEKDFDRKARMIYDWMIANTFRDPKVRGCGTGEIKTMLKTGNLGGKCADLSSLFVGLCRAAGVPAREVFGLRVMPSKIAACLGKEGDVSKAQHCRAEYLSSNGRWVPVDPADVRKVVLEEKLDAKNPRIESVREQLFGRWEMNWIAFNSARDFELPSSGERINYLMYPYLVSGTAKNDGMDPETFKYSISAALI